jgi:hypothetical protein
MLGSLRSAFSLFSFFAQNGAFALWLVYASPKTERAPVAPFPGPLTRKASIRSVDSFEFSFAQSGAFALWASDYGFLSVVILSAAWGGLRA